MGRKRLRNGTDPIAGRKAQRAQRELAAATALTFGKPLP